MIPTVAFPSFPDTETPSFPKVTLVSPFWIDSIFCNALANCISSLVILAFVASSTTSLATTLMFPFAPAKSAAGVPCPTTFNVVPNALCTVPVFPVKSNPATANACKSAKFTALSNPVVLAINPSTASLAFSAVTALFGSRTASNALAKLFNVIGVVVVPSVFTTLNSGLYSCGVGFVPPSGVITSPFSFTSLAK